MLKISQALRSDGALVLCLEGQVLGPWVEELRRICDETLSSNDCASPQLVLDLAGVSFLDANGIVLLRQLVTSSVSITNYSMFIAEQLKEVADVDR
jgi:anti-anti-sigma regulatory factor